MPVKSKAQFRLMVAAKHNPAFAKKVGIKPKVAAEFVDNTPSYKGLPEKKKHIFAKHPVGGHRMR